MGVDLRLVVAKWRRHSDLEDYRLNGVENPVSHPVTADPELLNSSIRMAEYGVPLTNRPEFPPASDQTQSKTPVDLGFIVPKKCSKLNAERQI